MEKRNYKEYRTTSFWTDESEDIVFFKYAPKLEIDIDVAKEIVESRLNYTKGKPVYTLIDFSNVKSVTKEARDYMNSPDGGLKGILGGAFLSTSVVATLFVNLYLKISNPSVPAKFFTSEKDALWWLKKIKNTNAIPIPVL
ncbi:MAG TPA: hypothetical protein VL728_15940 [Cyclobacteriaceae bacterium]|nr:hypothetical protein [Cyclobacteriaceae bacterium]